MKRQNFDKSMKSFPQLSFPCTRVNTRVFKVWSRAETNEEKLLLLWLQLAL
jgi:hypothetical protein